jgi:DNA segregation ATPase FtsK/SpoIIIE, S-DNA-T family
MTLMRLFFTVGDEARNLERDVILDADPGTTIADVVRTIEGPASPALGWRVGSKPVTGNEYICDVLLDGLRLIRGHRGADTEINQRVAEVELRIVGGPDAGKTWFLRRGSYSLGRDEVCDISLHSDPQVSRRHATLVIDGETVSISDDESKNGIIMAGNSLSSGELPELSTFQVGETVLIWTREESRRTPGVSQSDGQLIFSRPPRIHIPIVKRTIVFPGDEPERKKSPIPILATIAPLAIGILMAIVKGNSAFLLFSLMSPVMAIANYVSSNRQGKGTFRSSIENYKSQLSRAEQELDEAVRKETELLRHDYPDPAEVGSVVLNLKPRIWERRREDDDFLNLRIGLTNKRASITLQKPPSTDVEHRSELDQVPIPFDLPRLGVVGIAGPRRAAEALSRWLVAQAAVLHAPDDLVISVFTQGELEEDWSWTRWLPHLRLDSEGTSIRVANSQKSIVRLAGQIVSTIDERLAEIDSNKTEQQLWPAHLVVLDGARTLGAIPAITRILRWGFQVGVFAICIEDSEQLLPEECRATATFSSADSPRIALRITGDAPVSYVLADLVSSEWCDRIARSLAPLRLNRTIETAAVLPDSVRLLDLLGLEDLSSERLEKSWQLSGRSTSFQIGVNTIGTMSLDIRGDGPHGLVAGTTGSGKSELLQSIVASLAVANQPRFMNFVLVDYKGGSAFKDCELLPHTVGMVTDLDGHLTERALESIGAELRRRERLLQSFGVKDIDDYWELPPERTAEDLPRLLIVIDEFASLVEELPTFVDGLVDLARRGRSLGIHLILATQRPSGVVSAAIKTNTNLRIALRVTDAADSSDVVDSPLAARIPKATPGRAYVRVGHDSLTEFQSARVGGKRTTQQNEALHMIPVDWQTISESFVISANVENTSEQTDLSLLVEMINRAFERSNMTPARVPWLPPLPSELIWGTRSRFEGAELQSAFGLQDLPQEQDQPRALFDLKRNGHLAIAGDSGSGRTTALRTLALALAANGSAEDIHIYAIDCGSGGLRPLTTLDHCGAVIMRQEPDRLDRLINRLLQEIERRRDILLEGGFSSIEDQRQGSAVEERLPYVVVVVDQWDGFLAEFDELDSGRLTSSFLQILKEGISVGIRGIITGDKTVLSPRFTALMDQTIVLNLNDKGSYSLANLNPRNLPDHVPPGRGFFARSGIEIQFATLTSDPRGPEQLNKFEELAREINEADPVAQQHLLPRPIRSLPNQITLSLQEIQESEPRNNRFQQIFSGVGGDELEVLWADMSANGPALLLGGPARSGKSTALRLITEVALSQGHQVLVVVHRPSVLSTLEGQKGIVAVVNGRDLESLEQLVPSVSLDSEHSPDLIIIDDVELLPDSRFMNELQSFLAEARDQRNGIVAAGLTDQLVLGFRGLIPDMRRFRSGIVLMPNSPNDGEYLSIRLPKSILGKAVPGRGVLISGSEYEAIQFPIDFA